MEDSNFNVTAMTDAEQAPEAAPPPPARSSPLSRGNLLLAAMFAVGVAGIYFLHVKAAPAKASAAVVDNDVRMDAFLQTLQQMKLSDTDPSKRASSVINTFYYEAKQRQIPVTEVPGNPFIFRWPQQANAETQPATPQAGVIRPVDDTEARETTQSIEKAKGLVLQSVLTGSAGATAMISNNMLTVGQKIAGWTVSDIQPQQVTLKWKSETFVLKMR